MLTKRLFIAIDLPETIRSQLGAVSNYFEHPAVRWTPSQNLHVTLHFVGTTPESELSGLRSHISEIASKTQCFTLITDSITVVKKRSRPVMIWATMQQRLNFNDLVKEIQRDLPGDKSTLPLPHITLARINGNKITQIPEVPPLGKMSFAVQEIVLFESILTSSFPVYKPVETFRLHC